MPAFEKLVSKRGLYDKDLANAAATDVIDISDQDNIMVQVTSIGSSTGSVILYGSYDTDNKPDISQAISKTNSYFTLNTLGATSGTMSPGGTGMVLTADSAVGADVNVASLAWIVAKATVTAGTTINVKIWATH